MVQAAPIAVFVVFILGVGLQSERFLTPENAAQIVSQAAPTVVVAVGMTFVLLTGGVDLSVGALMFIGAGLRWYKRTSARGALHSHWLSQPARTRSSGSAPATCRSSEPSGFGTQAGYLCGFCGREDLNMRNVRKVQEI